MQLAFEFGRTSAPRRRQPIAGYPPRDPVGALAMRISAALGVPIKLVLTDNRRTMIATRRFERRVEVRLHRMFVDAPPRVIEELLCYLAEGDPRSSKALSAFIDENRHRIEPRRRILLRTRGRHHDLAAIFAQVASDFFPEGVDGVRITWGKMPPRRRGRRSIRLGTYTHDLQLVRIHPALDQAAVPRFFVEFVVFHELLHHVVPARRAGRRIDYHPPEFRARERQHPAYREALRWEAEHLDLLLGF